MIFFNLSQKWHRWHLVNIINLVVYTDFRITPVKSGFNTDWITRNMLNVKPRATLGLILFTVLIKKNLKNSKKSSVVVWKIWPWDFPCKFPQENPRANFPDNHCRLSIVYTKFRVKRAQINEFVVKSGCFCLSSSPLEKPVGVIMNRQKPVLKTDLKIYSCPVQCFEKWKRKLFSSLF